MGSYNQILADRWAQYASSYDEPEDTTHAAAMTTLAELNWDTVVGIIRPRLILLNAWLKVLQEMWSENQWGVELAEELCDDAWATGILVAAGASPIQAAEYVEKEWY